METILFMKNLDLEQIRNFNIEQYIASLDERDPLYSLFKMLNNENKALEASVKEQQAKLERYKKDEISLFLSEFIHYQDEETIPYLFEQYNGKLDELEAYINDVQNKLLELHKIVFGYDDFKLINFNNVGCISESFFEKRVKYEQYKDLTFIAFIVYMHALYTSNRIELDELKALLADLFDYDWTYLTDAVELMYK